MERESHKNVWLGTLGGPCYYQSSEGPESDWEEAEAEKIDDRAFRGEGNLGNRPAQVTPLSKILESAEGMGGTRARFLESTEKIMETRKKKA